MEAQLRTEMCPEFVPTVVESYEITIAEYVLLQISTIHKDLVVYANASYLLYAHETAENRQILENTYRDIDRLPASLIVKMCDYIKETADNPTAFGYVIAMKLSSRIGQFDDIFMRSVVYKIVRNENIEELPDNDSPCYSRACYMRLFRLIYRELVQESIQYVWRRR